MLVAEQCEKADCHAEIKLSLKGEIGPKKIVSPIRETQYTNVCFLSVKTSIPVFDRWRRCSESRSNVINREKM